MRFVFPHSHAFHRGRVVVRDETGTEPECVIEFADGVTVLGTWKPARDGIQLCVPAYRTAKGTQIPSKSWRIVQAKNGLSRVERVCL